MLNTEARVELAAEARRDWLEHAVRQCTHNKGTQRLCHDAVLKVICDMLESAGFTDIQWEDRWWDTRQDESANTRRPDVTAFNPRNRRRYVIDVVGAWKEIASIAQGWKQDGAGARSSEQAKWRSYTEALKEQAKGGHGWLCGSASVQTDKFVPFAFEIGGALGVEAEDFMTEVVRVAEYTRKGRGDLEHWSAMSWGGHWRQRIAVEIVRGLARCVERSATGTRSGGKPKSPASSDQEWHADCLH